MAEVVGSFGQEDNLYKLVSDPAFLRQIELPFVSEKFRVPLRQKRQLS